MPGLTAKEFTARLEALKSDSEIKKYEKYFPINERGKDVFIGVRVGSIFKLAKEYNHAADYAT